MTDTLAAALPREIMRCAIALGKIEIRRTIMCMDALPGEALLRTALEEACRAIGEGDTIAMIQLYQALKNIPDAP